MKKSCLLLRNKKGIEMTFPWLFALIAGIIILFLAIFMVTKIVKTDSSALDAATAKKIGVLLNPLETGFEEGRTTSFTLSSPTRIFATCNTNNIFGKQIIQVSQKSLGKWSDKGLEVIFPNKYIFTREPIEGKTFNLFSKPFYFPFKVSDLIYITTSKETHCFEDPTEDIAEELIALNVKNIKIGNCSESNINICFSGNCEIRINQGERDYVEKQDQRLYFHNNSLMYAAIFADKEIYECQVKRLMKRTQNLARLYKEKSVFVSQKGCNSGLDSDLAVLINKIGDYEDSEDLKEIVRFMETLKNRNENTECRLW